MAKSSERPDLEMTVNVSRITTVISDALLSSLSGIARSIAMKRQEALDEIATAGGVELVATTSGADSLELGTEALTSGSSSSEMALKIAFEGLGVELVG